MLDRPDRPRWPEGLQDDLRTLDDQVAFEGCERCEDIEQQSAGGGGCASSCDPRIAWQPYLFIAGPPQAQATNDFGDEVRWIGFPVSAAVGW